MRLFAAIALTLLATPACAGTTILHAFTGGADGADPTSGLIRDKAGNIYGTTSRGGDPSADAGTIFTITPSGAFTTLHAFAGGAGGAQPAAPMTLIGDTLYGSTRFGALPGAYGILFSMRTDGSAFTTLHVFTDTDGADPISALIHAPGHGLVGVAYDGGANVPGTAGQGTLFALQRNGTFRLLHKFQTATGRNPSSVVLGNDGLIYGATYYGGTGCPGGCGVIFSYNLQSRLYRVLYQFAGTTDGKEPILGGVGADGTLYGATEAGTVDNTGTGTGNGTLFSLAPRHGSYVLSTLTTFHKGIGAPNSPPVMLKDGTLTGTAYSHQFAFNYLGGIYAYRAGHLAVAQIGSETGGYDPRGPVAIVGGAILGVTYQGGPDTPAPCLTSTGTYLGDGCGVLYSYTPD